ncbi:reverse transcriptase domain-containing protein [Tanacetum coccineum]
MSFCLIRSHLHFPFYTDSEQADSSSTNHRITIQGPRGSTDRPPVTNQERDEREAMFIQPHDPDYVPEPIYPEYIPLEDEHEFLVEEQPLPPVDSQLSHQGMDDIDDEDEDEEEEEPSSRPTLVLLSYCSSINTLPPEAEVERLLAMPTPSPSPPISLSPPSAGERLARCTAPPALSSPPPVPSPLLPSSGCPTQIQTLRMASTQALVDAVTAALPSPPLPPLPPSLYIPPPVDRRDDIPESEQPPRKRLCLSTLGSRYEVGESSTARPTGGRGIDYGFVSTVDAEARRQGISEVGYGIRDTCLRSELEANPESMIDTGHLYALLRDAQSGRTPHMPHRVTMVSQCGVDLLIGDRMTLQETVWDCKGGGLCIPENVGLTHRISIQAVHMISYPPVIMCMHTDPYPGLITSISTSCRAHMGKDSLEDRDMRREKWVNMQAELQIMAPATRRGPNTTPNNTNPNNITPESVQAMIDQALPRNSTNKDRSHRNEGIVGLTRWIEKMESVFNISGCAIENQVKFTTCTLFGAVLTWWNGQIRSLDPDAYSMTWEMLKKKMTDKYCSQGEIKKLKIELWNLKVKGNDVLTYTERFQELTLICTKFVANETEKIDKYISGLTDNIYGSVKSSRPKTLDETIELANDFMDQKLHTYAERQTNNKRKADDSSRNNHEVTQGWVYAVGNAEKKGNASRDPDSNVVTGTFLLNNRYASILFDTGADRSFISSAFSSLIDIAQTPLENSYDVELADGKIVG